MRIAMRSYPSSLHCKDRCHDSHEESCRPPCCNLSQLEEVEVSRIHSVTSGHKHQLQRPLRKLHRAIATPASHISFLFSFGRCACILLRSLLQVHMYNS